MKKPVYPCLWFYGNAKEAASYYCNVFPNTRLLDQKEIVSRIDLNGRLFMLLNGDVDFPFNESVSFVVECDDQAEIDRLWDELTREGEESMCGWCKDKFGVSWQIIPAILGELMNDPQKAPQVMQAFLKMRKFDIQALLDAV